MTQAGFLKGIDGQFSSRFPKDLFCPCRSLTPHCRTTSEVTKSSPTPPGSAPSLSTKDALPPFVSSHKNRHLHCLTELSKQVHNFKHLALNRCFLWFGCKCLFLGVCPCPLMLLPPPALNALSSCLLPSLPALVLHWIWGWEHFLPFLFPPSYTLSHIGMA